MQNSTTKLGRPSSTTQSARVGLSQDQDGTRCHRNSGSMMGKCMPNPSDLICMGM